MPIMDDATSKQLRSSLQLQASNLCSFPISFRFTLLCKNAFANHLESHSCENKGLKIPWNHTLTKNIGGRGALRFLCPTFRILTSYLRFSLTPLDPTLTSKWATKSFSFNTYKKQGEGGGGRGCCRVSNFAFRVSLGLRLRAPCHGRAEAVLFSGHQALCFQPQHCPSASVSCVEVKLS